MSSLREQSRTISLRLGADAPYQIVLSVYCLQGRIDLYAPLLLEYGMAQHW